MFFVLIMKGGLLNFSLGPITIVLIIIFSTAYVPHTSLAQNPMPYDNRSITENNQKVAILTFDDGWQSQYQNAKPILDKYGFKGTFFIVCNYIEKDNSRMSWDDVKSLKQAGHDIQAHTMNHKNLNKLSAKDLNYELSESKQCLGNQGINSTIMATPLNEGWNNSTVIQSIAKYYELARNGNSPLMFLHCDKWQVSQTDCRTFSNNGSLTFANKYSIRAWSHNFYDNKYEHNETRIFDEFVKVINSQEVYNNYTKTIVAIPILIYHNIDNTKTPYTTTTNLFQREMNYLRDNGFRVLTMSNLKFDNNTNYLYINQNQ
jgi:peptidoglycan/xylan/chitin deacetylase (PgdA/CDA1 family)